MFMSTWKKKILGGVERIFKDGRVVMDEKELQNVPAVVRRLEPGDTLEFEDTAPLPPEMPIEKAKEIKLEPPKSEERVSIVSGEPATRRKFLNGEIYWLTEEEARTLTLGKLAQIVREKSTKTVEES